MKLTVKDLIRALIRVHPDAVLEIERPDGYAGPVYEGPVPQVTGLIPSADGKTIRLRVEVPRPAYDVQQVVREEKAKREAAYAEAQRAADAEAARIERENAGAAGETTDPAA